MSGVIMADGTQWEHCSHCNGWVKIQDLYYLLPNPDFHCGLDLGVCCAWMYATDYKVESTKTGAIVVNLYPRDLSEKDTIRRDAMIGWNREQAS